MKKDGDQLASNSLASTTIINTALVCMQCLSLIWKQKHDTAY